MNRELITKKDYEILGIKENSTPREINSAYEKLISEYHPEKIKLEKHREPNDLEIKKYKEIDDSFKKFDLAISKAEYLCCGIKGGVMRCMNEFYPALWIKVEDGQKKYFCSQECYNSKWKSDELVEKWEKEDKEWEQKKLAKAKKELQETKTREINNIKRYLERANVKQEELEPNNRNFEQKINQFEIKEADDSEWIKSLYAIIDRVEKDIQSKSKRDLQTCDYYYCKKSFKNQDENGNLISYGAAGKDGHYTFCSEECREKGMKGKWFTVERKSVFTELLKWMEKEGVANISIDQGKLVLEFSKNQNQKQVIEDSNLTSEQKEIKNFLQQIGKSSLSQSEAREGIKGKDKSDSGKWIGPALGIGIIALIVILIGVVIYKNKKKGY